MQVASSMITVAAAKEKIRSHAQPLPAVWLPLRAAAGCTLAVDVFAPDDLPRYAQSAMDGYAFRFADRQQFPALTVRTVVAAGDEANFILGKGEAVRIFTGAAMPAGADTVVMQEKTNVEAGVLWIRDEGLVCGSNVRSVGFEIAKGALALAKGGKLTAGAIGYLASMGMNKVMVHPRPAVALLITGKELQEPGTPPQAGKVYEANSYSLQAALQQYGITEVSVKKLTDSLEATSTALQDALADADLVLVTGGVSVGDFDFVVPAAAQSGVQPLFHKVKQRPGKPLYCGIADTKMVFGLPGNPSSVLTCFYQYVVPALEIMMQQKSLLQVGTLPLAQEVEKKTNLTHFLKGRSDGASVTPLPAQESYRLSSFAVANCLIEIPEESDMLPMGTPVTVYQFGS